MLLVEGNTSTQVKYLQHGLRMLCFNPKRLDGVFDTNTTLAVKRYQTSRGLTSDGKVGDGTWNKLKSDIIPLQTSLKNKGYYSGTIDGVAGDATYNALVKFQSDNGLTADGMAGQSTLDKLHTTDTNKPILQLGSTGKYVIELQTKLIKLGYSCGDTGADGVFGDDTYRAVRMFQQNNNLSVDGKVGPATWAKIDSENTVKRSCTKNDILREGSKADELVK